MNKNNIFTNLDRKFEKIQSDITEVQVDRNTLIKSLNADSNELKKLEDDLSILLQKVGLQPSSSNSLEKENYDSSLDNEVNDLFFNYYQDIDSLESKILSNHKTLPSLDALDISIIGITGAIATIIDILIVSIPKDMNYLSKFEQGGSDITQWLKSLGINKDGKLNAFFQYLENNAKVPFDQSINNGNLNNFYPGNHRMLNVSHDPIFGLIFGLIDMINGQMTVIDGKGLVHIVKTKDMSLEELMIAPLIWVSHIISDICTKQGIPVPGSAFTQFLQFGSFGDKNRNIADISRWMYQNGYDLRHFITMAIVPASIEIIIRLYHNIKIQDIEENCPKLLLDIELKAMNNELKLQKMLFMTHLVALGGNGLKVFSMAGNPMAINIVEWSVLLKKSITIFKAIKRDKTVEKIQYNREFINNNWKKLGSTLEI